MTDDKAAPKQDQRPEPPKAGSAAPAAAAAKPAGPGAPTKDRDGHVGTGPEATRGLGEDHPELTKVRGPNDDEPGGPHLGVSPGTGGGTSMARTYGSADALRSAADAYRGTETISLDSITIRAGTSGDLSYFTHVDGDGARVDMAGPGYDRR